MVGGREWSAQVSCLPAFACWDWTVASVMLVESVLFLVKCQGWRFTYGI